MVEVVIKKLFIALLFMTVQISIAGVSNFLPWNKEAINVCFGDQATNVKHKDFQGRFSAFPQDQKEKIKQILNEEFTPERTGYHFVGFKDCKDESDHDVILVRKPVTSLMALSLRGKATIGRHFNSPSDQFPKSRGVVMLTSTGINKSTIIHEFGHILGLMHEHVHPDSQEEAQNRCRFFSQSHQEKLHGYLYSSFDEISVMNYCHILYDKTVGLSMGDVVHIQILYMISTIKVKRKF